MSKKTATQLEHEVEKKVTDHAKRCGFRARKVAFVGRRGAPDRWYFGPGGRLIIIEFKAPGKLDNLSFAQGKHIKWMLELDFEVHVIDNIEDGKAVFDRAA